MMHEGKWGEIAEDSLGEDQKLKKKQREPIR
jgi:hypothetical protein